MQRAMLLAGGILGIGLGAPRSVQAVGEPQPGAVSAQTVKVPDGPGSVRGLAEDAQVNGFTGQVRYRVPIELPAGPGGLRPEMALSYAGDLGNGPLGVGWTLGQAGIRRSTRLGVPGYDGDDELEIVGVADGQLFRADDGTYRVEGMGNGIVVAPIGDGFVVTTSDGTRFELGLSPDARKADGARTAFWYLERVTELTGERIDYHYSRDRGEVYLERVTWGPGDAFVATFEYGPRLDEVISWRTGFEVVAALRLDRIVIESFGTVARTMELAYDDSFALSRLTEVRMRGRIDPLEPDDVDELPPLTFHYAGPSSGPAVELGDVGGWMLNRREVSLFDVDKDGAMDLLRMEPYNHQYRRNLGGHFDAPRAIGGATSAQLSKVRLLDLTGDSGAELVRKLGSSWRAYRLESDAWVSLGSWPGTAGMDLPSLAVADLDGDFQMDAISSYGDGLRVWMGSADGFSAPITRPAISTEHPEMRPGEVGMSFPDVNGDGLADALHLGAHDVKVYLGRGDGTFALRVVYDYPWAAPGTVVDARSLRAGDLNRDGLLDLVRVSAGHVHFYPGRPDGTIGAVATELPRPAGSDTDVVVALADANGNGSVDVVWSADDGMWALDMTGPTTAGMLTAVDNGLGKVQSFDYQASTALAWEDEVAGAPWDDNMPVAIPVATRETQTLASGDPARVTELDVRDGIYDRDERRFVGFAETTTTRVGADDADTARVTRRYHPGLGAERALRGRLLSERVEDGAGRLLQVTRHEVGLVDVVGLPAEPLARRPVTTATVVEHFEGAAEPVVVRTRYEHDDEGRVVVERQDGRLDVTGDERITQRSYVAAGASGVRDLVCRETLWGFTYDADGSSAPTLVSDTRTLFGDESSIAGECEAGKGWVRRTERYLASEDRWVEVAARAYDVHGNAVSIHEGGIRRSIEFDTHGLHPVAERVAPDAQRQLAWTATWDLVLGVQTSVTDASGVVTRMEHDGLGRVTGIAFGDAPPHRLFRYDWRGPRPITEILEYDGPAGSLATEPAGWHADGHWRQIVHVTNGAGEALYRATRLADEQWIISALEERDARGRTVVAASDFYWTGDDLATVSLPALTPAQVLEYDALDRVIQQTLPTGAGRTYTYEPLTISQASDDLVEVRSIFDGHGQAVRTERTVNGEVQSVDAEYDAAGRITAMHLGGDAVTHRYRYDTLGRLVFATDPDVGDRHLGYDDRGLLRSETNAMGQTVTYEYDGAARLTSVTTDADDVYRYHYDVAAQSGFGNTGGRLAWVEEPTGTVHVGYDASGRQDRVRRTVIGRTAEERSVFSPSGLLLAVSHDDSLHIPFRYDRAGRIVGAGDLWYVDAQDAAGRVLSERFGNDVTQRYQRDPLGLASQIELRRAQQALYRVDLTRNGYGAVVTVDDTDGHGLDHDATFTYDGAARLTAATLGGSAGYSFSYQYDALQNMVSRSVTGPTAIDALTGTLEHGGPRPDGGRYGPRQLGAVVSAPGGTPVAIMDYDAAGRQIRHGERTMIYNGLDQLIAVQGLPGGAAVAHAYGYDGLRVHTVAADGSERVWFTADVTEAGNVREYYVRVGDRLIAKIAVDTTATGVAAGVVRRVVTGAIAAGLLGWLAIVAWSLRRRTPGRRWIPAVAALLLAPVASCGTTTGSQTIATIVGPTLYYHYGFAAGPVVITRADGSVLTERRYSPFGVAIDCYREDAGGSQTGPVSFLRESYNILNKRTDPDTGWSDHGARWLAPQSARWLTPDPPVKAPDPRYMREPWSLHPYQYVDQNPVLYWDRDGRDKVRTFDDEAIKRFLTWITTNHGRTWVPPSDTAGRNACEARGNQCGCIVTMNKGLQRLHDDKLGWRFNGPGHVRETMESMAKKGLATDPVALRFADAKGRPATGGRAPDQFRTAGGKTDSLWDTVIDLSGGDVGWSAFGMGIADDYHAVTLILDNRDPTKPRVIWTDQVNGAVEYTSKADLDARLLSWTQKGFEHYQDKGVRSPSVEATVSRWLPED